MTTTQINWPTRIGLSLQAYVGVWANETELGFHIVVEAVEGLDLFGLVDPDA
jgi:hypothetical protein